jgi:hypothetical protein
MTVKITIPYEGEDFLVEITNEGIFSIVSADMEYEIAYAAMSGEDTNAMVLSMGLQVDPASFVCYSPNLDHTTLSHIAADWAEHAMQLSIHTGTRGKYELEHGVQTIRDFLAGRVSRETLEAEYESMGELSELAGNSASKAVWYAARVPLSPSNDDPVQSGETPAIAMAIRVAWQAEWTAENVARYRIGGEDSKSLLDAAAAERAWQAGCLARALEHVRAGKPWPKIRKTKRTP